jgi:ABC-2 type transport system permease protein
LTQELLRTLWLLRHESKLAWRRQRRAFGSMGGLFSPLALGSLYAGLHAVFLALQIPPADARALFFCANVQGTSLIVLAICMTACALPAALEMALERNGWTQIILSPFPLERALIVRMLAVAGRAMLLPALLVTPAVNIGVLHGQWWLLSAYPGLLCLAFFASALSVHFVLSGNRWLGASRSRTAAAFAGATFVAIYLGAVLLRDRIDFGWLGALLPALHDSLAFRVLDWLGGAFFGALIPLAALFLLGGACLYSASIALRREFLESACADGHAAAPGPIRRRFTLSRSRTHLAIFVLKEWRLVLRDPGFFVELLRQIIVVGTILLLIFTEANAGYARAVGPIVVVACGMMANELSWRMAGGEQAIELLLVSPMPARKLRAYKFLAATIPAFSVLAVLCACLIWIDAALAVSALSLGSFAVLGSAAFNIRCTFMQTVGKPEARRKQDPALVLCQGAGILGCALGLHYLPERHWGVVATAAVVTCLVALRSLRTSSTPIT